MQTVFSSDVAHIQIDNKGFFWNNGSPLKMWLTSGDKTPVMWEEILSAERYINGLYRVFNPTCCSPSQTYKKLIWLHENCPQLHDISEVAEAAKYGNLDSTSWPWMFGQAIRNIVAPMHEYGEVFDAESGYYYEVYRASGDVFSIYNQDIRIVLAECTYEPDRKIVKVDNSGRTFGDLNAILKRLCIKGHSVSDLQAKIADHRFLPFDNNDAILNGIKLGFDNYQTINLQNFNWAAKLGQVIRHTLESHKR